MELVECGLLEAAFLEIGESEHLALVTVAQLFHKVLLGKLVDDEEAFALAAQLFLLRGLGPVVLNGDVVLLGQILQRFRIGHLGVLHQEMDGVALGVAHEALVDAEARGDVQRRVLVVVERTHAHKTRPLPFQGDEVAHHILNLGGKLDFLYGPL